LGSGKGDEISNIDVIQALCTHKYVQTIPLLAPFVTDGFAGLKPRRLAEIVDATWDKAAAMARLVQDSKRPTATKIKLTLSQIGGLVLIGNRKVDFQVTGTRTYRMTGFHGIIPKNDAQERLQHIADDCQMFCGGVSLSPSRSVAVVLP